MTYVRGGEIFDHARPPLFGWETGSSSNWCCLLVPLGVALDGCAGVHKTICWTCIDRHHGRAAGTVPRASSGRRLVIGTFVQMLPASVRGLVEGNNG